MGFWERLITWIGQVIPKDEYHNLEQIPQMSDEQLVKLVKNYSPRSQTVRLAVNTLIQRNKRLKAQLAELIERAKTNPPH